MYLYNTKGSNFNSCVLIILGCIQIIFRQFTKSEILQFTFRNNNFSGLDAQAIANSKCKILK